MNDIIILGYKLVNAQNIPTTSSTAVVYAASTFKYHIWDNICILTFHLDKMQ